MSDKNKFKFEPNNKYFTIVIYGLMFVFGAVIICGLIGNFGMTLKLISGFLSLISPFLTGFFIAFLLHPMVKFFYRRFFTKVLKIKSAKVAKWLSIILTYIIAISVIAILVLFVAPQVYQSVVDITEQIPVWYSTTISFIENLK